MAEAEQLPEGMGKRGAKRGNVNTQSIAIHKVINLALAAHPLVRGGASKNRVLECALVQLLNEDHDALSARWLRMVQDREDWLAQAVLDEHYAAFPAATRDAAWLADQAAAGSDTEGSRR